MDRQRPAQMTRGPDGTHPADGLDRFDRAEARLHAVRVHDHLHQAVRHLVRLDGLVQDCEVVAGRAAETAHALEAALHAVEALSDTLRRTEARAAAAVDPSQPH